MLQQYSFNIHLNTDRPVAVRERERCEMRRGSDSSVDVQVGIVLVRHLKLIELQHVAESRCCQWTMPGYETALMGPLITR